MTHFPLRNTFATTIVALLVIGECNGLTALVSSDTSMWKILDTQPPAHAWKTIFGKMGDRGEYMDGYSEKAMVQRCEEDYKWEKTFAKDSFASERAAMMSHLYDSQKLWKHVSMVAFAEHYVLGDSENISTSFDTFQKQKALQLTEEPIFSGVVLRDWETCELNGIEGKLAAFKQKEVDYVRLECNLGTMDDIGEATQLVNNEVIRSRFCRLTEVAKACQTQGMVPVILLQVPWRDVGVSIDYFEQAVKCFAVSLKKEAVEPQKVLFETRPPIGMTARDEKSLTGTERIELGLRIGRKMFEIIDNAFAEDSIAGFCVAGGSTKGECPTAMEDDTQNAVRQGMRQCARAQWGYDLCFWEMGAKLMLQPKVGRLWGNAQSGRDAARELFSVNAEDMADEIKAGI